MRKIVNPSPNDCPEVDENRLRILRDKTYVNGVKPLRETIPRSEVSVDGSGPDKLSPLDRDNPSRGLTGYLLVNPRPVTNRTLSNGKMVEV